MTWNLIEALKGLVTRDEFGYNDRGRNVMSVKSHYPASNGSELEWDDIITRGFILIRNPRYAIPSLHNFIYKVDRKLPAHSTRPPLDVWRVWRDAHRNDQLRAYSDHLDYWMESLKPPDRLIFTYEGLTNEASRTKTAASLA